MWLVSACEVLADHVVVIGRVLGSHYLGLNLTVLVLFLLLLAQHDVRLLRHLLVSIYDYLLRLLVVGEAAPRI